ncbi:hypothetical protein [Hymenobacter negativus]|uniref:SPW repeat-containing integral membrane domain-containing protein n=1 Tax=Hymenobacter negativus TaxID=2795026 RepID=A0ABS3Q9Y1_9BACT|nr:hypothetical protein [Hymenobacter negativus]MBO2007525.1 hypothetical protein [Hymenobacter negativus]
MNTPLIPRPVHGVADYLYVPTVAAAPDLFGFAHNKKAARICRIVSGGVLASTLFTRAEWGVWKLVPYKAHLFLDFAAGVGAMAMPWLAGFAQDRRARNTFLGIGAISLGASLLSGVFSNSEEMPLPASSADEAVIPGGTDYTTSSY